MYFEYDDCARADALPVSFLVKISRLKIGKKMRNIVSRVPQYPGAWVLSLKKNKITLRGIFVSTRKSTHQIERPRGYNMRFPMAKLCMQCVHKIWEYMYNIHRNVISTICKFAVRKCSMIVSMIHPNIPGQSTV